MLAVTPEKTEARTRTLSKLVVTISWPSVSAWEPVKSKPAGSFAHTSSWSASLMGTKEMAIRDFVPAALLTLSPIN